MGRGRKRPKPYSLRPQKVHSRFAKGARRTMSSAAHPAQAEPRIPGIVGSNVDAMTGVENLAGCNNGAELSLFQAEPPHLFESESAEEGEGSARLEGDRLEDQQRPEMVCGEVNPDPVYDVDVERKSARVVARLLAAGSCTGDHVAEAFWSPSTTNIGATNPFNDREIASVQLRCVRHGVLTWSQYHVQEQVARAASVLGAETAISALSSSTGVSFSSSAVADAISKAKGLLLSTSTLKRVMQHKLPTLLMRRVELALKTKSGALEKAHVVLPSTQVVRDLSFTDSCNELLSLRRSRRAVPFEPPEFVDTDIHQRRRDVLRPAPYGLQLPTKSSAPSLLARLVCQGSTLELRILTPPKAHDNCSVTDRMSVELVGEPIIAGACNDGLSISESRAARDLASCLLDSGESACDHGDIAWAARVLDSNLQTTALVACCFSSGANVTSDSGIGAGLYVVERCIHDDCDPVDAQGSNCTVPAAAARRLEVGSVTPLSNPDGWTPGSLRPSTTGVRTTTNDPPLRGTQASPRVVRLSVSLFTDDCNVGRKAGSFGGVYMSYLTTECEHRTGSDAIRVLGIAPPGVDSDKLLESLISDLVDLAEKGLVVYTAELEYIRLYVDFAMFIADYVQVAHSSDSKGHASTSPCTVCSSPRGEDKGLAQYVGAATSADLRVARSGARLAALQSAGLVTDGARRRLGLSKSATMSASAVLNNIEGRKHAQTSSAATETVMSRGYVSFMPPLRVYGLCVPHRFDCFLSMAAGPDHLLVLGLGRDLLRFLLSQLAPAHRDFLNRSLLVFCNLCGLPGPSSILKVSTTANDCLVSLSVTECSSLLSMLPVALEFMEEAGMSVSEDLWRPITLLVPLIVAVYFIPRIDISTSAEAKERYQFMMTLVDRAWTYVKCVRTLSAQRSSIAASAKSILDKPNLHRLLEFALFWLPAVSHNTAHMNDILFEKKHQAIKAAIMCTSAGPGMAMRAMKKILEDETMHRLANGAMQNPLGPASAFCPTVRAGGLAPSISDELDDERVAVWTARTKLRLQQDELEARIVLEFRMGPGVSLGGNIASIKFTRSVKLGQNGKADTILSVNDFVTATLDTDVASQAGVLINRVIRGDGEASFSKTRIAAKVCHLVVVSSLNSNLDGEVFVRGKRVLQHGSSKRGLESWKVTGERVWLRLDTACRRAAAFPCVLGKTFGEQCRLDCSVLPVSEFTNPIVAAQHVGAAQESRASNSGGVTSLGSTKWSSSGADGVVLLLRHHGYPSRCG